jgi:hypothetical protein
MVGYWNGVPIDLAVARNASREAGCNMEARRARGLEALTIRWLGHVATSRRGLGDVDL